MQGGASSSEFRIPDSELDGSVELRVPSPQPSRLTPVPSDKILFPRRMLYVEAVLYVVVAAAAFGLGYLAGRGGQSAAGKQDDEVQMRVPVEGKVLLNKRGEAGAVVIALPVGKWLGKPLPITGLRPGELAGAKGNATSAALAEFGGASALADASGNFTFFVPVGGSYRILILSRRASREPDAPPKQSDILELEKYFQLPSDLLKDCHYCWLTKDLRLESGPLEVEFTE